MQQFFTLSRNDKDKNTFNYYPINKLIPAVESKAGLQFVCHPPGGSRDQRNKLSDELMHIFRSEVKSNLKLILGGFLGEEICFVLPCRSFKPQYNLKTAPASTPTATWTLL